MNAKRCHGTRWKIALKDCLHSIADMLLLQHEDSNDKITGQ